MANNEMATQVRAMYERFNQERLDAIEAMLTPDFIDHDPDNPTHDRAGTRQFFSLLLAGFHGARFDVEEVLADGDRAAVRFTLTGTQSGEFAGIPATGRQIRAGHGHVPDARR